LVLFRQAPIALIATDSCQPAVVVMYIASQSDRIGRIFAHWVTVCFGQIYENDRSRQHFWLLFPLWRLCFYFDKNGLGYILGESFSKLVWSPWLRLLFFECLLIFFLSLSLSLSLSISLSLSLRLRLSFAWSRSRHSCIEP
jgi:hypothetical protein